MHFGWKYGSAGMVLRTLATKVFRIPDRSRWMDLGNHDVQWDRRTRALAQFVPSRSFIIEFGAGRRQLERWLPADCEYLASDIVSRGPDAWVCDLNHRPLPPLRRRGPVQVAAFSGVLEYVTDVSAVVRWLSPVTDYIVASYNCVPSVKSGVGRLRNASGRLSAGWVNAFADDDLQRIFEQASFRVVQRVAVEGEADEYVYLFERVVRA